MGSIIKTISLDSRTQKIAETIPNFSQWVRAKLLDLEEKRVTPAHNWAYICNVCGGEWRRPDVDRYFYCRDHMKGHCDNKNRLMPRKVELE